MTYLKSAFLIAAAFSLLSVASPASAAPIYTCPGDSTQCEGQTFALWIEASGAGFTDIAVSINTTGYDGGANAGDANDRAYGIEFKEVFDTNTILTMSLLSAPGGTGSWRAGPEQLSQDCELADGDFKDTGCAAWISTGQGYDFTVGEVLTWIFRVNADVTTIVDDGFGHIKYEYRGTDATGKATKEAGLLSASIPLQDCREGTECDEPFTPVPEPTTMSMLGLGLLGAAARVRARMRRSKDTL
jgi:hypothetical protein